MNYVDFGVIGIIAYLLASVLLIFDLTSGREVKVKKVSSQITGFIAFAAHILVLWQLVVLNWVNLGFYHALSFVSVFIVGSVFISNLFTQVRSLLVFAYPLAALFLGLEIINPQAIKAQATLALDSHILLSILAYGFLAVGAMFGILLFVQEYMLKHNHLGGMLKVFPPLTQTESMMFNVIGIGFLLLTTSLISGFIFLENIFSQHLVHKTFFSIVSWLVFAILLFGRYKYGWRGKTAVRFTLSGFFLIMLAYFGSKLVLEKLL